jgi:hypothetical protein
VASNLSSGAPLPCPSTLSDVDIVLLNVTTGGKEIIDAAQKVRSALCHSGASTRILCFSTSQRNSEFVLELERCGARYVRVSDPKMLMEALELLVAEISNIERNGPCFRISHRFSQGACAPGEEIAAIELVHDCGFFQLPLALSGRFVFNYLAENRSLCHDAFQIASGLSGWFYREHGLNGGTRQTVKIRVPTIKVIAQRIRLAMDSAFATAGLSCDPFDVLRSFQAVGSTRALYRLRADIRWEHRTR